VSGMCLDASQLGTLCRQLSSLTQLTSLQLSNIITDLTPDGDDRSALDAVCSLLSSLPSLRRLNLSDICLTTCVCDILASIASAELVSLELTEQWLDEHDRSTLQHFQQRNAAVLVKLNYRPLFST